MMKYFNYAGKLLIFLLLTGSLQARNDQKPVITLPDVTIVSKMFQPVKGQISRNLPLLQKMKSFPHPDEKESMLPNPVKDERLKPEKTLSRGCLPGIFPVSLFQKLFYGKQYSYKLGVFFFNRNKFAEAKGHFLDFLEKRPSSEKISQAYYWLAEIYHLENETNSAIEVLKEARGKIIDAERLSFINVFLGELYVETGSYEKAVNVFTEFLEANGRWKNAPLIAYKTARSAFLLGDYEQACKYFSMIKSRYPLHPQRPAAIFWMAECRFHAADYSKALELYELVAEKYEKSEMLPDAYYGKAWAYIGLQDYERALQTFDEILRRFPRNSLGTNVLYQKARLLLSLGREHEAELIFKEISDADRLPLWKEQAMLLEARKKYGEGNYSQALNDYRKILNQYPDTRFKNEIYTLLAASFAQIGKCESAIPFFDKALEVSSGLHRLENTIRLQKGICLLRSGNTEQARTIFDELLRINADSERQAEIYFWSGETYLRQGKYENAGEMYRMVLQFDRNDLNSLAGLGLAWVNYYQEKWPAAAEYFLQVARQAQKSLDHYLASSFLGLGDSYYNMKKFENALDTYDKFIDLFPDHPQLDEAMYQKAIVYRRLGRFRDAEALFSRLAEADDHVYREKSVYEQAVSLFQSKNFREAAQVFNEFLTKNPESELAPDAALKQADCWYNLEFYEKAREKYSEVIDRYPDSPETLDAQYGIGLTYLQTGNIAAYADHVEKFVEMNPDHPQNAQFLFTLAQSFADKGYFSRAISYYSRILEEYREFDSLDNVYIRLADACQRAGLVDRAVEAYQSVPLLFPDSKLIPEALFKLSDIYIRENRYDDVLRVLERFGNLASSEHPLQENLLFAEFTAYVNLKQIAQAEKNLLKFVDEFPQSSLKGEMYLEMAKLFDQKNVHDKALEYFNLAIRNSDPEIAAEAYYRKGELLAQTDEIQTALTELMKVVYLFPQQEKWVFRSLVRAADLLVKMKNDQEAMKLYRKALEFAPDEQAANEIRKKMNP